MKNPKIRFIDDSIDWQENILGNMGKTFNGLTGKTKNDFGHGTAKYITYINVYKNTIALPNEVDSIEIDNSQNQVIYGDILFTVSSETPEEVGLSSVWLYNENNVYLNSFCFGYRPSNNIDHKFMGYLLRSNSVRKKIILLAQGISRYNISKNKVMEIKISLPSLEIQKQISSLLSDIDQKISSQEILIQKLKNTKSALLIKTFPQENQSVPELRFDGFTNDWEQRKVKELCLISTGKSNTQDKTDDGKYPFYVRSPIVEKSNKYLYDEEAVITIGDGVGTGKVFHYINGKYDLHQRCYRMYNFSNNLNAKYFYHIFAYLFYDRVMSMTAKTSVDSVRLDMIADMQLPTPNIYEQQKISALFENLDNLITLHQRKLDKLKEVKSALLDKLLV